MGLYRLPPYRPDGLNPEQEETDCGRILIRPRLYVEVSRDENFFNISGNPVAVKQLYSYFTGDGWEAYDHIPIPDCVSPCVNNCFTLDISKAKQCLMREKIGTLFFDMILDGLSQAARGYDSAIGY